MTRGSIVTVGVHGTQAGGVVGGSGLGFGDDRTETGHSMHQAMISWVRMETRPLVSLNGSDAPLGDEWQGPRWASGGCSRTIGEWEILGLLEGG
ncbi:hypothetical protein E2C01_025537 [Portunus trituberculatus]|uniref:Uncharacterized protein n=1 Tax=Portunus trituberculatus TaxID=210409 RepID=A0A5B7EG76_PORTR|nr:hypothetical protein [Portunus trituberculatus]